MLCVQLCLALSQIFAINIFRGISERKVYDVEG